MLLGPDFNCLEAHAHELGQLLRGRDVVVNLIPWNPVLSPDFEFRAPPAGTAGVFQGILRRCYGLPCTVRQEKGQDVAAACGQLVLQQQVMLVPAFVLWRVLMLRCRVCSPLPSKTWRTSSLRVGEAQRCRVNKWAGAAAVAHEECRAVCTRKRAIN